MAIKRIKNIKGVVSKGKASLLNNVNKGVDIEALSKEIFEILRDKGVTAYEAIKAMEIVTERIYNLTSHSEILTLIKANKKMEE